MYTAKAIIAIYNHRFNYLALSLSCKKRCLFYCNINFYEIFNANKLVKAEISLFHLSLVILTDACCVDVLSSVT